MSEPTPIQLLALGIRALELGYLEKAHEFLQELEILGAVDHFGELGERLFPSDRTPYPLRARFEKRFSRLRRSARVKAMAREANPPAQVTVHVHNTVEIPPVEHSVQKLVRDENREITEIHTRRVRAESAK